MNTFQIIDTLTREVVATRKTVAAARKWAQSLNAGMAPRYTVITLAIVA